MKKVCLSVLIILLMTALCASFALGEGTPEDGVYTPDAFSFTGGTGKVTITVDTVTVSGGDITGHVVFSSPNYTRVIVDGVEYAGEHDDDSSSFDVPVKLNEAFTLIGTTTAMSQPHDVEYMLFIALGQNESALAGLTYESTMPLEYAECFTVDYYEGGYMLISVADGSRYLIVPEGAEAPDTLDPEITVIHQPLQKTYMAASAVMAFFSRLDALDSVRFSGTNADDWTIESAAEAMEKGDILFAGKYSEPDYELLVKEGCDLAIESTMVLHTPKVKELIELLNIPVLIDYSSYEPHPLDRTEWIKLYGALLGREAEAEAFFDTQKQAAEAVAENPPTDKVVSYFYIGTDGQAVVRGAADYVARMIELGGAKYAFSELTEGAEKATVSVTMEDFYAFAVDADYLIYQTSIDTSVKTLDDLMKKSPLFEDFKAVKDGNVYSAGKGLYQATDIATGLISDIAQMLSGDEGDMLFLSRLD